MTTQIVRAELRLGEGKTVQTVCSVGHPGIQPPCKEGDTDQARNHPFGAIAIFGEGS